MWPRCMGCLRLDFFPDCTISILPSLFSTIENNRVWPDAMHFGFCSLIPKEPGDLAPLGQRPLGVMSFLYCVYCAYRLMDVIQWQEKVLHHSQHGFRQGHSCDDVFYDIALSMEEALLSGNSLTGVHFDYKKAFVLVPRNIIFNLASRLGFSSKLLDVMKSIFSTLQRFFKLPGGHSKPFKSSCGILQGCPFSVVFMNLIVSSWCRTI